MLLIVYHWHVNLLLFFDNKEVGDTLKIIFIAWFLLRQFIYNWEWCLLNERLFFYQSCDSLVKRYYDCSSLIIKLKLQSIICSIRCYFFLLSARKSIMVHKNDYEVSEVHNLDPNHDKRTKECPYHAIHTTFHYASCSYSGSSHYQKHVVPNFDVGYWPYKNFKTHEDTHIYYVLNPVHQIWHPLR